MSTWRTHDVAHASACSGELRFAVVMSRHSTQRGVTLLEMLIVVTIIAIVAGLSFPSAASGLDTLRLRSASDSIVSLLNTALDRADRRQQAVEITILPKENAIVARSADLGFNRRVDLQEPIHINAIFPTADIDPAEPRHFLVYPGGTVPGIGVELANRSGRKRMVSVDPVTGVPQAK
jgi:prepilin-type N-terminal cleavage/methylation domain-containing protein